MHIQLLWFVIIVFIFDVDGSTQTTMIEDLTLYPDLYPKILSIILDSDHLFHDQVGISILGGLFIP
ncbi:hypothetical protein QTP88_022692 [Uroleucon formosanum]